MTKMNQKSTNFTQFSKIKIAKKAKNITHSSVLNLSSSTSEILPQYQSSNNSTVKFMTNNSVMSINGIACLKLNVVRSG